MNLKRASRFVPLSKEGLALIEQQIHESEFEIGVKILPYLKKAEKEILQKDIMGAVEATSAPEEVKKELRKEASEIQSSMAIVEKQNAVDQVKEYVSIGRRIFTFGQKVWKYTGPFIKIAFPVIPQVLEMLKPIEAAFAKRSK